LTAADARVDQLLVALTGGAPNESDPGRDTVGGT
jgi:hypothetical protein